MDLQLLQEDTVFFDKKQFRKIIDDILNLLTKEYVNLSEIGDKARALILSAAIPDEIRAEILLTNR
jgi:pyruvate,water dikinase